MTKRNILLTKDSVVKLADLGLSKLFQSSIKAVSLAGTKEYMSPEMRRCFFDDNEFYSDKTDIWFDIYFFLFGQYKKIKKVIFFGPKGR